MPVPRSKLESAAFACAFGAAAATMFSITISQSLLAAGLIALLFSGATLRMPPIGWPLGLFAAGTLLSLVLSDNPAAGIPQLRKFFVFLILLLMASTFKRVEHALWLVQTWVAVAVLAALRGFWQFTTKYQQAQAQGTDFYVTYVSHRITGFMSHWMTFSGMQMVALLLGAALLLFGNRRREIRVALAFGCVLIAASIVLSLTRGIWIGTAVACLYLLWSWKWWSVALVPLAIGLLFLAGPATVRSRLTSFVKPHGEVDSNQHRIVTWRTGLQMIRAHPWFGLGPEMVGREFDSYVPADIPRPLPEGWYGHLHNIYLQYSAERGIPTMLMLLWLLAGTLWHWWNRVRRLPLGHPARWLLHGSVAALAGTMVSGFFEHNLGDSEVLLLVLAVICLGYLGSQDSGTNPVQISRLPIHAASRP